MVLPHAVLESRPWFQNEDDDGGGHYSKKGSNRPEFCLAALDCYSTRHRDGQLFQHIDL